MTVKAACSPEAAAETLAVDWQLALAGLRGAIRRVGGQMAEVTASDNTAVVKFSLRGAAERLSTGRKSA